MNGITRRIGLMALSIGWLALLTGCFGNPSSFMKQSDSQGSAALITMKKSTEAGITSGTLDPDAFYPQILSAADEGDLAGTSATFPPGSLAISTEITIQEGASIATAALAGSLSISSGFQATAAPVAVMATQDIDAAKPFTIAIPVPSTTTSLFSFADPFERLVVAYVIKVAETGETRMGVMPRSALILNGNQVQFETMHFGIFQAALTVETILEERKADTVASAIQTKSTLQSLPAMAITGRSRLVVKEGETITLSGQNFRPTIRLALNCKSISSLNLASDASLSFVAPADTSLGLVNLTADQEGQSQNVSLIFDGKGTYPVISDDKSKVCNDVTFYDLAGTIQTGTRVCNAVAAPATADCASDGEVGCKTTNNYKAAKMANFTAGDLKTGVTVAGMTGGATIESHSNCAADGDGSCVVDGTMYKAAKMANFTAANIAASITIAGVVGSGAGESHSNCAADGATGCVATLSYPAADAAMATTGNIKSGISIAGVTGSLEQETHTTCSSDGQTGCAVIGPSFKAADMSLVDAGNIKSGTTLIGVPGQYPSSTYPLAANTALAELPTLTSSVPAGSYEWFLADGTRVTGTIADAGTIVPSSATQYFTTSVYRSFTVAGDPDLLAGNILNGIDIFGVTGSVVPSAANCSSDGETGCVTTVSYRAADMAFALPNRILSGFTIAGVPGTASAEAHVSCSFDGEISCATNASYKAADMANVTPGNIRSGMTIAGMNGQYPSATYPLMGADSTDDLDAPTFNAKIKSLASFEYFDSTGTRYLGAGDTDIANAYFKDSVDIFGTIGVIPYCSGDGQQGCLTTSQYKSADTNAYTTWDIRKGKSVGGKAGDIVFYKNMIGSYNYSTTPAVAGNDVWDTVDDYNNNSAFPATAPSGWDQATGANWVMDLTNDVGGSGGTANDNFCSGSEACVFKDQITGLMWAKDNGSTYNWQDAITQCDGLSYGGYSDWRLPTQKELLQAYTNGIWSQKALNKLNLSSNNYWSATTASNMTAYAWAINLGLGSATSTPKSNTANSICVRTLP